MRPNSSRAFRRWCAASILLVGSWSLPGQVYARVSPMEIVKYQLRKPNFLIVVESAASMQGIPGENPARFNEIGADCENGDRFCRLDRQPGRCEFSGMGQYGFVFDSVPAGTDTAAGTQTASGGTMTVTRSQTGIDVVTPTVPLTSTSSSSSGQTVSASGTLTVTGSASGSGTETRTPTVTRSATSTNTGTATPTQSLTASTTNTGTTTQTQSRTASTTNTGTATPTLSRTVSTTGTGTTTPTQSQSVTTTNTGTTTQSVSQSVSTTNTGTATPTQSRTVSTTNTATGTPTQSQSVTTTNTGTTTQTQSQSVATTNTATATPTQSRTVSTTNTATATPILSQTASTTNTATATPTLSRTVATTNTGTATPTLSQTVSTTNTGTATPMLSQTVSTTNTGTATPTLSRTVSTTNTGTGTPTLSQSVTTTNTGSTTQTVSRTATTTNTGTATPTLSQTVSTTNTGTATPTLSQTVSTTNTGTATPTLSQTVSTTNTGTATPTLSRTVSTTNTGTATPTLSQTVSTTNTGTATPTLSQTVSTTNTGTATPTQSQTMSTTNTGTATPTLSQTVSTTNTGTATPTKTQTVSTTNTGTATPTQSQTVSTTNTATATPTQSQTVSTTNTGTATPTLSQSMSTTNTGTATPTRTQTATNTGTKTPTQTTTSSTTNTFTMSTTNTTTTTSTTTRPWLSPYQVGHWKLDDASTSVYADSWGAHPGSGTGMTTASNTATFTALTTRVAKFQTATSVGTNYNATSYIAMAGVPAPSTAGLTVAVWVNRDPASGSASNSQQALVSYDGAIKNATSTATATGAFRLQVAGYGNNICADNNDNTQANQACTTVPNPNEWHLIAATIVGSNWTIYNYTAGNCPYPATPGTATLPYGDFYSGGTWYIGATGNDHKYGFWGVMDQAQIWNYTMGTTELQNVCQCGQPSCSMWDTLATATNATTATKTANTTKTLTATQTYPSTSTVTGSQSRASTATMTGSRSYASTATLTGSQSYASTATVTGSQTYAATATVTGSQSYASTATVTGSRSYASTATMTGSQSYASTATVTGSQSYASTATVTGSQSYGSTATQTGSQSYASTATVTGSQSYASTATVTGSQSYASTATVTGSQSYASTATVTGSQSYASTATVTGSQSYASTATVTGSQSYASTATVTASQSYPSTVTVTGSQSYPSTVTVTGSQSYASTSTVTASLSYPSTSTVSASQSYASTATVTQSQSYNTTSTVIGTQSTNSTGTITGTETAYSTGQASQAVTALGTATLSATTPLVVTAVGWSSTTQTVTDTQIVTGTATTTFVMKRLPDTGSCAADTVCSGTQKSRCYLNSSQVCSADSDCGIQGDVCQNFKTSDPGRVKGDTCVLDSLTGYSCRYHAKTCSGVGDSSCGAGDYCVRGNPAEMCQKSGLWCDDSTWCDSSDSCVPATSRLMMVKDAVRRVMLEHAYDDSAVVKMGHMHTYQAGLDQDTRTPSNTSLFAYVKLDTSLGTSTRTDVKFLPRSELLKGANGPCFSETSGPSSSCTIDYSGGGAVDAPAVQYTLQGGSNSRYAVPSGDGKTYLRSNAAWNSSCGMLCPVSGGTGLYEGSYYTFSYAWGTPVGSGDGSVLQPHYYTTYKGKSFSSGVDAWYLMDAERTEYVNEDKYGAKEFRGQNWSTSAEYPLPLSGIDTPDFSAATTCDSAHGGQWDSKVVPMANDTVFPAAPKSVGPVAKALMNAARLEKASYGGFYATGNTESVACALKNDVADSPNNSVSGYMSAVQGADKVANGANGGTSPCWENHVLLVVDGLPRGPGDVAIGGIDCSASACVYDPASNPNLDGCNCPAVTKARNLAKNAGVNVHVIAASTDLTSRNGYAAATLNNIARAGSTNPTFINIPRYAASEDELYYWLNYEMKEALRVTVATTPASAASGSQSLQGISVGNMLFQTTVELPEWRGSLVGFSISSTTGTKMVVTTTTSGQTATATATALNYSTGLAWDAAAVNKFTVRPGAPPSASDMNLWQKRRVFFSDTQGHVYRVTDDSGAIIAASKSALLALGMGANQDETGRIIEWMLGKIDPNDSADHKPLNPAVMGSVLNSMPIDVGPPGASALPGGNHFWFTHALRNELVYLGADDGMLHAFKAATGKEAFAFIPADMIPTIAKLYAQGGQRYSPNEHVYGLAGSPKVKNLCVANCKVATGKVCSDDVDGTYDAGCPEWRTVLVMGEGPGGNHPFALDITDPLASGAATLTDDSLLWHVGYKNATGVDPSVLGETDSVPAFAYNRTTDQTDNRVILASSGYSYPSGGSITPKLVNAAVMSGSATGSGVTEISKSASCTAQAFAVVADVAIARDNFHNTSGVADQNLLAAYVADTWGTLHQYYGANLASAGTPISLGCQHPLHFAPALVQLNRNNMNDTDNSVYLAQVTNSIVDPVTVGSSFPASKLVVAKLTSIGSVAPALDATFGTSGLIQLSADASSNANRLCGVTTTGKSSAATDCGPDGSWLPESARPTGTPVAVLHADDSGFQIYTTWYTPPAASWDNCPASPTNGNSYITLHEFLSNGTWAQVYGMKIAHQYVTGVQFVGTTLFITSGDGSSPQVPGGDGSFGQTFSPVDQAMRNLIGDRFIKTAWAERIDAE